MKFHYIRTPLEKCFWLPHGKVLIVPSVATAGCFSLDLGCFCFVWGFYWNCFFLL